MASEGWPSNPRLVLVGEHPYEVVVTNKFMEAGEWAQEILRLPGEETRVVGLSLIGRDVLTVRGSFTTILECIHVASCSRVLIYHLNTHEGNITLPSTLFPVLFGSSLLIGEDMARAREILKMEANASSSPTLDLREAVGIFGLPQWALVTERGHPLHVVLAKALLGDVDASELRTEGLPSLWIWPLSDVHVQAAVEKVIIAEKIGKRIIERQRRRASDIIRSPIT